MLQQLREVQHYDVEGAFTRYLERDAIRCEMRKRLLEVIKRDIVGGVHNYFES